MSEKPKTVADQITLSVEQVTKIIRSFTPYYGMIKFAARLAGVKIPSEIDEVIDTINKGETPDLTKLQDLGERLSAEQPKVGETVTTRYLAYEAHRLHYQERMGTREIADFLTKEGSPCSHSTVARMIQEVDAELEASKRGRIVSILKYAGIAGAMIVSMLIGKFLLG